MALLGHVRDSWRSMAPLGQVELRKTQYIYIDVYIYVYIYVIYIYILYIYIYIYIYIFLSFQTCVLFTE